MTKEKLLSLLRRRDALALLVNEGDTELVEKLNQVTEAIEEGWQELGRS